MKPSLSLIRNLDNARKETKMTLVLIAFLMVTGLGIAAILKLEDEKRAEQFARLAKRSNRHFTE